MSDAASRTDLLLIRHAQSEWNATGRWQGQADPPLSAEGERQAKTLAERLATELAGERVDCVYCSDLRRARATAERIAEAFGLELQASERFRELDVGDWSGLTRDEILARDAALLERFESDDPDARPGGGETRREIRERAHHAVADLVKAHPGERIVVVCHLGFLRALLPDAEPANAELIRIDAREALSRRARFIAGRTQL